jgi:hypothetical protein
MPKSGKDTFRPATRYGETPVIAPDIVFGATCASVGQTNTSAQTLPTVSAVPRKAATKAHSPKVPATLDWRP